MLALFLDFATSGEDLKRFLKAKPAPHLKESLIGDGVTGHARREIAQASYKWAVQQLKPGFFDEPAKCRPAEDVRVIAPPKAATLSAILALS